MRVFSFFFRFLLSVCIVVIALNNLDQATMVSKSNYMTQTVDKVRSEFNLEQAGLILTYLTELVYAEAVIMGLSGFFLLISRRVSRFFFLLALVLNFGLINNYYFYRNENVLKTMSYMVTIFGGTFL
jgi:hypothetical protein